MTKYKIDYINQNILTKKFYYNTNTDESDNNKFILDVNLNDDTIHTIKKKLKEYHSVRQSTKIVDTDRSNSIETQFLKVWNDITKWLKSEIFKIIQINRKEILKIGDYNLKVLLLPIIYDKDNNHTKKLSNWDYLNIDQIEQLDNIMYKKKDSCFYDEILSYDSILINHLTVSSNYNRLSVGSLIIFHNDEVIGFLSYQYVRNSKFSNRVLIENICLKKDYRGKGLFSPIFNWFLKETYNIYNLLTKFVDNFKFDGYHLTVWNESPYNKNNEIVDLYKKYGFYYVNTQNYSDKRTYIHMLKSNIPNN